MKICIISMNLFMYGGVQRVLPSVLNPLVDRHEMTVLMPYDESKDKNVFGLSERIRLKNLYEFPRHRKTTFSGALALSCWKMNQKTGVFDNSQGKKLAGKFMFSQKQKDALTDYVNREKFDLVIGVTAYYSLLVAMIAPDIQAKTIGWEHNTFESYFEMKGRNAYGLKQLFIDTIKNLDRLFVLTDIDRKKYMECFSVETKTLYNPVSIKCHSISATPDKDLIFVGRLYEYQKGLDYLVRVMKTLVSQGIEKRLSVVGDGVDRNKLEQLIKQEGLEPNIQVVGMQDHVEKFYDDASIFIHTSRYEGFGVVLIEAMMFGLPVVAFHNNGPDEIITDGVEGYLIDKYDIDQFAEKIIKILSDSDLYRAMSEAAHKRAKNFLPEHISDTFEKYCIELMEGNGSNEGDRNHYIL